MSKINFANTLLGLVLAASAALAGNASAQVVDYYRWDGLCTDCVPSGMPVTAMVALKDYTGGLGNGLTTANFVSFSYRRNDGSFSVLFDSTSTLTTIGGWVPAKPAPGDPLPDVDTRFNLAWTTGTDQYSFTTTGAGGWTLSLNNNSLDEHGDILDANGIKLPQNEYHESSHFHFDHEDDGGHTSPVPEPESYAMLLAGLGLLGFAARRRKQQF